MDPRPCLSLPYLGDVSRCRILPLQPRLALFGGQRQSGHTSLGGREGLAFSASAVPAPSTALAGLLWLR